MNSTPPPAQTRHRATGPLGALTLLALATLPFACRDALAPDRASNAPITVAPTPYRVTVPSDADLQAEESIASYTSTVTMNSDGTVSGGGRVGPNFAMETIYQVAITGSVYSVWLSNGQTTTWGTCARQGNDPRINHHSLTGSVVSAWSECATGTYRSFTRTQGQQGWDSFEMGRFFVDNCGGYGPWMPCERYGGSFTVTGTRVAADYALVTSDTTISTGGTATFKGRATPDSIPGPNGPMATPVWTRRTFFEPDPVNAGGVLADSTLTCSAPRLAETPHVRYHRINREGAHGNHGAGPQWAAALHGGVQTGADRTRAAG